MAAGRGRILLIMLAAVVALAVGEVLLSKGMRQTAGAPTGWVAQLGAVLRNSWIWGACVLLLLHVGLYMAALRKADLSFALPLTAASYPLAALLARFYLHEQVGPMRWVGIVLITVGVAIVGIGEAFADR